MRRPFLTIPTSTCFSFIIMNKTPRNSENRSKQVWGGGQSSTCQNFIFNPELHKINQLAKKQSIPPPSSPAPPAHPGLHLFSHRFCGRSLRARRNGALRINTRLNKPPYSSPVSESVPSPSRQSYSFLWHLRQTHVLSSPTAFSSAVAPRVRPRPCKQIHVGICIPAAGLEPPFLFLFSM